MSTIAAAPQASLATEYARQYPGDVARALEAGEVPAFVNFLGRLPHAVALQIFERVTPSVASTLIAQMEPAVAGVMLGALDPARGAALLADLETSAVDARLAALDDRAAKEIRELMTYPPESAGGLMSARVATCRPDTPAGEVLSALRTRSQGRVTDVVLTDPEARVVATVAVEDLALADPTTAVSELVRRSPATVGAMASRDEVMETMTRSGARTLPVTDVGGRLLGVLRQDALVRAVEEEFSADLQTMVGASKEEQALSPVSFAVKKRLPWLQINLVTAFAAAAVVGVFEQTIAQVTALAVLLPVVAGQSGNTGAQALAVTMRGLALREIRLSQWRRVAVKESMVGLINGVGVALTTSLGTYVWSQSVGLAAVIGSSMVISMLAAGLSGAVVPMALTAAKQDPAQSSSIVLTTVTDIVGFFSFLGIATLMMQYL